MADEIFLSYARSDKERAKIFAEALDKLGYSIWWDRNIPHGRKFDEYILEKLNGAKCVIVLWSKDSVKSDWVRDEAERGKRREILVPVLIDDVDIPLGFGRFQTAQLFDWDEMESSEEFERLSGSIAEIVGSLSRMQEVESHKPEEDEAKDRVKRKKEKPKSSTEKEEKTFTNSIGMKFILIPAGKFVMGEKGGFFDQPSEPVHEVTVNKPFYLGIYPVTQKEWKAIMGTDPSDFKGDKLPVETVLWDDVQDFIKKLNEKEGTNKYRLPSEAEWEYAARGGTKTKYSFGDDKSKLDDYAWYYGNSGGKTHEVGQKKPNKWGLYDMHGNVWEWLQDKWHKDYNGAPTDGSPWESGDGSDRVVRGGCYGWEGKWGLPEDLRSADRYHGDPGTRNSTIGFRLLREI